VPVNPRVVDIGMCREWPAQHVNSSLASWKEPPVSHLWCLRISQLPKWSEEKGENGYVMWETGDCGLCYGTAMTCVLEKIDQRRTGRHVKAGRRGRAGCPGSAVSQVTLTDAGKARYAMLSERGMARGYGGMTDIAGG